MNKNGLLEVGAPTDHSRYFVWMGERREFPVKGRVAEWYGRMGAVNPSERINEIKGITRLIYEDGEMDFPSQQAAMEWLSQPYQKNVFDVRYTSDGLVIGFSITQHREQIDIDITQILINGQKPRLSGASDADQIGWR